MQPADNPGFTPPNGGYPNLLSYKKAEIIYDGTIYFTGRFLKKGDRTIDQMVQAARSGKQNIAEASIAYVSKIGGDLYLCSQLRKQITFLQ